MAYSQFLVQPIRKLLALKLPPQIFEEELEEKKLFGGLAFMIRGKMVLTVSSRNHELVMVRIGKKMEKQVLSRVGAHTTLMRGRLYHGYIDLDIEGQKELPYWIELALSYNQELTK